MRAYEVMLLLKPELEEETRNALLERVNGIITSHNGLIENTNIWGKKRMAYEINNYREAVYVIIDFKADFATTSELERVLKLQDNVLRFMLVRKEESKAKVEEVKEETEVADAE